VYLSADIEDGYDDDPEQVAAFAAGLGVDGINIEDSTGRRRRASMRSIGNRRQRSEVRAPAARARHDP
jgi:2-methylisocitrate lyase-like PEP mutase family enzyme